jgi:hypothetical protein
VNDRRGAEERCRSVKCDHRTSLNAPRNRLMRCTIGEVSTVGYDRRDLETQREARRGEAGRVRSEKRATNGSDCRRKGFFFFFFFKYFGSDSGFSIKPDPLKTRLKPVSVNKKNPTRYPIT